MTGFRLTTAGMTSNKKSLLLLTFLTLLITLPFVNRAYFVDDFYFVTIAKGILEHPTRPYDFRSDDAGLNTLGWERGQQPRMVNPLLFHYFLAAVIKVWGEEVWKLRTASLIFSLISVWSVYFVGKRFVRNAFAAASLLAVTPAFWVSSYSLLIDSALLAFFLAALVCFIEGHERKNKKLLILSGLLIGATLLTKYTGVLIVPVVMLWHYFHKKTYSFNRTLLALAVGLVIFLLWGVWGIFTYGQMHFTATLSRGFHPTTFFGLAALGLFLSAVFFGWKEPKRIGANIPAWVCGLASLTLCTLYLGKSQSLAEWLQVFYIDKAISVASFLGGTTVFLFAAPVFLGKKSLRALGLWVLFVALLFLAFSSRFGGFNPLQSAMLAFFIGASVAFGGRVLLGSSPRSASSQLFLLLWVGMGVLELILVMPWTAARYLLIVLPPVCWLFQKWLEEAGQMRFFRWIWGMTVVMGMAIAYADYAQANVIHRFSQVLETQQAQFQSLAARPPKHWYYLADTFDGTQPYVLRQGWESVFPFQEFEKGSLLLRSRYRRSSWWNLPQPERFPPIVVWEYPHWLPLRVMDIPASAGFYASCWGSLPYAITRHPLERFELSLVQ